MNKIFKLIIDWQTDAVDLYSNIDRNIIFSDKIKSDNLEEVRKKWTISHN